MINLKLFFIALILMTLSDSHSACLYKVDDKSTEVTWRAFKTPKKVGVDGRFSDVVIKTKPAKDLLDLIRNASFSIKVESLSTGNPARDQKILENFFRFKGNLLNISGKVLDLKGSMAKVLMKLGDSEREVLMKVEMTDTQLSLSGKIDVLTFGLSENLSSITEAFKALHQGVTWPDVEIGVTILTQKQCD